MRGNPVRYHAVEFCDQVRRNVFCRHYDDCLDHAISKRWPGFSCDKCDQYECEEQTREYMIRASRDIS